MPIEFNMDILEDITSKILLPFEEEKSRGCKNSSVIGGFDKYVINWLDKILLRACANNILRERVRIIQDRMRQYTRLLPKQRENLLKEISSEISALKPDVASASDKKFAITPRESMKKSLLSAKREEKFTTSIKLASPVTAISGIGPRLGEYLNKMGLYTVEDILYHLPRDYQDRREICSLDQVEEGKFQIFTGTIEKITTARVKGKLQITKAAFRDDFGFISLVWFNQPYIQRMLKGGVKYIVSGKVEKKFNQIQINSPEIEEYDEGANESGKILPLYPLTDGISHKFMRKIANYSIKRFGDQLTETLPEDLRKRLSLPGLLESIKNIHFPPDMEKAREALFRIKFEEAFFLQMAMLESRRRFRSSEKPIGYMLEKNFLANFENSLSFRLTSAQKKVIDEISLDMMNPYPMNRLLQGDVGSGKTIVCAFGVLGAAKSGYQAAILAPTEVLAEQHFYNFKNLLQLFGLETALLIGATKPQEKAEIKERLASGDLPIVVGTHALLQEDVSFKNLAFAVVDEQHKFGVMQRVSLKEKGAQADFLYTTATPIPRSLCFTLYGDLDLSVIDELPPGRQDVETIIFSKKERDNFYSFLEKELKEGGRAYIICPLIEESEKIDATPLYEEFERIRLRFPLFAPGILHGRMKSEEKEKIMGDFARGDIQILISTTVVEVGVDVPQATVMVIIDADRFGLGQLHQLRGRVGRGDRKSYCILVSDSESSLAQKRLNTIVNTKSGFKIAEEDLRTRGPGDFSGVRQSGFPPLKFIDIVEDYDIIQKARREAFDLYLDDNTLKKKENQHLRQNLYAKYHKVWDIIH